MARKVDLPRVWEVAVPHPDIFAGDLDPARFAISLNAVDLGKGAKDYVEPDRFFDKTFMTRSLKALLMGVLARLVGGGEGVAIRHLQTPFGGGKTHTLTALYHLAKHPEVAFEKLPELFRELGLEEPPAPMNVAVLDGVALNPQGRRTEEGLEIRTLWGELAYRLGGKRLYRRIEESDRKRTPPGAQTIAEILEEAAPALILVDEFVAYLVKARGTRVGDGNLAEQSLVFLQELATAASGLPRVALVATLPQSSLEVAVTREEEAQRLLDKALHILGRQNLIETPVAADEIFGVLRKRLFSHWGDERIAEKVARAFRKYYSDHAGYFPEEVQEKRYGERIFQAYPFHPEFIDILQYRWGPHHRFQRTRGALRTLAFVIRDLWERRPGSAYLIQPWAVDLSDRPLRGWIVELPGTEFETVITSDILDKGRALERGLKGDYYKESLVTGVATAALLYSVSASPQEVGATEEQLRLAVLRPRLNPAMVAEVLSRMRDQFWYLVYRDRKYRFQTRPNLNKILRDFELSIGENEIEAELASQLEAVAGRHKTEFHVAVLPENSLAVMDRAEPVLVFVPWEAGDERAWMEEILRHHGEAPRVHRNALVFVAPERALISEAKAKARKLLALKALKGSSDFKALEPEEQREVDKRLRNQEDVLQQTIRRAYTRVFRPCPPETVAEIPVRRRELVLAKTVAEYVWEVLKEEGQLLEKLDPSYLVEKVWKEGVSEELPYQRLWETFWQQPGLPLLTGEEVLREAIVAGGNAGLFGVVKRDLSTERKEPIPPAKVKDVKREEVVLVSGKKLEELEVSAPREEAPTEVHKPSGPQVLRCTTNLRNLYPLRELLNQLQGLEGKFTLEIEVSGGLPEEKRCEIERLLRDYSINFELKQSTE